VRRSNTEARAKRVLPTLFGLLPRVFLYPALIFRRYRACASGGPTALTWNHRTPDPALCNASWTCREWTRVKRGRQRSCGSVVRPSASVVCNGTLRTRGRARTSDPLHGTRRSDGTPHTRRTHARERPNERTTDRPTERQCERRRASPLE